MTFKEFLAEAVSFVEANPEIANYEVQVQVYDANDREYRLEEMVLLGVDPVEKAVVYH